MSSIPSRVCAALLPATLFVGVLSASEEAKACSGLQCGVGVAPANGEQVPVNLPALKAHVFRPRDGGLNVELVSSAGTEVPVVLEDRDVHGGYLIRPSQPLTEGETYVLRLSNTCEFPPPDGGTFEASFTTSAPTPLPTSLGALSLRREGHWNVLVGASASCSWVVHSAYAQFAFEPSPPAAAFLPLTRWTLEVDGKSWVEEREGAIYADGGMRHATWTPIRPRRALVVHAECPDAGLGTDRGLEEGTHTAVLRGKVAGTEVELETEPVEFTLSCSGDPLEPVPFEEGYQAQPAPPAPPTPDEEEGSGCAAAGGGGLAALLLLGAVERRRRSRAS